ncbi:MAG: four-carbon acid sugar kinase family protein [Spirochaetota bacterium]
MSTPAHAVIIADDLTGACDTGVQLARIGSPCPVVLADSPVRIGASALADIAGEQGRLVVDTESRHLPPDEAHDRIRTIAASLGEIGAGVIYKKVDSTLRGRIAAEIEALCSVYEDRVVVVAPAYPAAGRTTVDGICLVDGVAVHRTEFGHDRRNPVRTSRIVDHLPGGTDVEHATVATIERVLADSKPGQTIVVDAETGDDLGVLARHVAREPARYLLVGSAGLAAALGTTLAPPGVAPASQRDAARSAAPVLGIVGSLSERSRDQVAYLRRKRGPVCIDVGPAQRSDAAERAARALEEAHDVLVATVPRTGTDGDASQDDDGTSASALARALGEIALEAVRRVPTTRLFVTGGDTAVAVLAALHARVVYVYREIAPGVPAMTIVARVAGRELEVPAVTKAGGFGEKTVMDETFACLGEGTCLE